MTKDELTNRCDRMLKVARNLLVKHTEFPIVVSIHHPAPDIGWTVPELPDSVLNNRAMLWDGLQMLIEVASIDAVVLVSDTFLVKVNHNRLTADGLKWTDLKSVQDAVGRGYGKRQESLVVIGQMDGEVYSGMQEYERQGKGVKLEAFRGGLESDGGDRAMLDGGNLGRRFDFKSPGSNSRAS